MLHPLESPVLLTISSETHNVESPVSTADPARVADGILTCGGVDHSYGMPIPAKCVLSYSNRPGMLGFCKFGVVTGNFTGG